MKFIHFDSPAQRQTVLAAVFLAVLSGAAAGLGALYLESPLYPLLAVIGTVIVLLVIRIPEIGLLVLVFITYTRLSNVLVDYHGMPSVMKFYLPFLFGIVALRWLVYRDEPKGWQLTFAAIAMVAFVNGMSIFYARNPEAARSEFSDLIKDSLMALAIVLMLKKGATLRHVVWALLLAGIFLASLTTYQYLAGSFENNFGGFALTEVRNIAGEVNDYRIQGPVSSNYYALVLVVLAPLAVDRLIHEKSPWLRLLAAWALVVAILSILFTYSRGGLLALVFVLALLAVRYRPRPAFLVVAVFSLTLAYFWAPDSYLERLGNLKQVITLLNPAQEGQPALEESALRGRLSEMTVSALVFADHPLLGVGYANFEEYYLDYSPALGLDARRQDRAAHSLYLEIAAETGVIGLAAFGFLLYAAFRSLRWSYARFKEGGLQDYANLTFALGVSLAGYLAGSVFLHSAYFRYFWLIFGIACAVPQVARYELESLMPGRRSQYGKTE